MTPQATVHVKPVGCDQGRVIREGKSCSGRLQCMQAVGTLSLAMVSSLFAAVPHQATILLSSFTGPRGSLNALGHKSCFADPSVVITSHRKSQGQHLACPAQASVIKDLAAARRVALGGPFLCCNDSLQHMQR